MNDFSRTDLQSLSMADAYRRTGDLSAAASGAAGIGGAASAHGRPGISGLRPHIGRNRPVFCRFCPDSEVTFAVLARIS
jgi:hypothetical protein